MNKINVKQPKKNNKILKFTRTEPNRINDISPNQSSKYSLSQMSIRYEFSFFSYELYRTKGFHTQDKKVNEVVCRNFLSEHKERV